MLADKVVNIAYYIPSAANTSVWYPNGTDFEQFIMDVESKFPLKPLDDGNYYSDYILLLLCRTGGRAAAAAERLRALGYTTYTIEWGFQGPANDETYPGPDTGYQDVYGWVNAKLPYNGNKEGGDYRTYEPEP